MKNNPVLLFALTMTLVGLGAVYAWLLASFSVSTTAACFDANMCDGLTFRAAAELLLQGGDPYDRSARIAHVSATVLDGDNPAFDLPFQYPPNALPWIALRGLGPAGRPDVHDAASSSRGSPRPRSPSTSNAAANPSSPYLSCRAPRLTVPMDTPSASRTVR